MLGSYVAEQAAASGWETWASYSTHPVALEGCRMIQLDLADAAQVSQAIEDIRPDVIIHTAGRVKPDFCEQHKRAAFESNVIGTHNIVRGADKAGAHLVHISTDVVFDGERNPYREGDSPSAPNYYALTKAAGEAAVLAAHTDWAVVRTSVIYGPSKFPHLNSFSDEVIESLRAGKPFMAFTDQRRCPIPVWNLADVLLEIAERRLTGVYHGVCPESSTRYEFARKIAEVFGYDHKLIKPITMDGVDAIARRPKTLVLDVTATARTLHTPLLGFEEGIHELRQRMG